MAESSIEWTQHTWNPVTGCTKLSPGCKHCYAESMAKRLKAMGTPGYENGFKLTPAQLEAMLQDSGATHLFIDAPKLADLAGRTLVVWLS